MGLTENKVNHDDKDGSVDEIVVGNDGMTIEAPKSGSTVEEPPNGGVKAWGTAAICCLINFCLGATYASLHVALNKETLATESGQEIEYHFESFQLYQSMTGVFSPIAALSIIHLGYRITVLGGGIVGSMTFVSLSFTRPDEHQYFRYCLLGPAALSTSFVVMGALIPILEYFTTKRMRAIFLTSISLFVGSFVFQLSIPLSDDMKDLHWEKLIRHICGSMFGVIAVAGLFLQELKLKMKDSPKETFVQRALGISDLSILKNGWLIGLLAIAFLFQLGADALVGVLFHPDVLSLVATIPTNLVLYILLPFFARIIGAVLAWLLKRCSAYPKEAGKGYRFVIVTFAGTSFVIGVMAFVALAGVFGTFLVVAMVSSLIIEYFDNMRDDYIPLLFGRSNIRIVEGLLLWAIGLGEVISTEIAAAMDMWQYVFDFGGAMLLLTAVISAGVAFYLTKFRKNAELPIGDGDLIEIRDT